MDMFYKKVHLLLQLQLVGYCGRGTWVLWGGAHGYCGEGHMGIVGGAHGYCGEGYRGIVGRM